MVMMMLDMKMIMLVVLIKTFIMMVRMMTKYNR